MPRTCKRRPGGGGAAVVQLVGEQTQHSKTAPRPAAPNRLHRRAVATSALADRVTARNEGRDPADVATHGRRDMEQLRRNYRRAHAQDRGVTGFDPVPRNAEAALARGGFQIRYQAADNSGCHISRRFRVR